MLQPASSSVTSLERSGSGFSLLPPPRGVSIGKHNNAAPQEMSINQVWNGLQPPNVKFSRRLLSLLSCRHAIFRHVYRRAEKPPIVTPFQ